MKMLMAAVMAAGLVLAPVAQADTPSPQPSAATGLTWGTDDLDPGLLALENDNNVTQEPGELLIYLIEGIATGVQGIARGTVVIVGTGAYVALVSTGNALVFAGGILPGPVGNVFTYSGEALINTGNWLAEAIHIGPYSTLG